MLVGEPGLRRRIRWLKLNKMRVKLGRLNKALKEIQNSKSWNCVIAKCNRKSARNHLLQKKGILNKIAPDSHLYRYETDFFSNQHYVKFVRKGINKVLTVNALCQHHDDKIFAYFEKSSIDSTDYTKQLLLSLRASLTELRKDEIIMKWHNELRSEAQLENLNQYFIKYNQELYVKVRDSKQFINEIIENLNRISSSRNTQESFLFERFILPKYEICASGVYNFIGMERSYLDNIFIHIIPTSENLEVIIGCHKDSHKSYVSYVKNFEKVDAVTKLELLTDILLTKIENWVCSQDFYNNSIVPRERYILDLVSSQFTLPGIFKCIDQRIIFNLFQK